MNFFFFQAEDGIRDGHVTGVQTCALPISARRLTVGADYEYFRPTFDGDSIFNFFTHNPMTTITGRLDWDVSDQVDLALGGGVRSFVTDGDPNSFVSTEPNARSQVKQTDILGNVAGRYRYENGLFGLRGLF